MHTHLTCARDLETFNEMAPPCRAQNVASKSVWAAAVLLATTAVLQPASLAFTSGPILVADADFTKQLVLPSTIRAHRFAMPSKQVPHGAQGLFFSSATILCVTAGVALQALRERARAPRSRCCVVACHAIAHPMEQNVQPIRNMPDVVSTSLNIAGLAVPTEVPCLLDMSEPTCSIQTPQPVSLGPLEPVMTAAVDGEKLEAPASHSVAGIMHRSARFVAGVRFSRSLRAGRNTNRRSARAARRAVGSRLVSRVQHREVQDLPFDSSRVRLQIQAGLRSASRVRSEHAKESQLLAAIAGGQSEHVLNIFTLRSMDYDYIKTYPMTCRMPQGTSVQRFAALA